MKKYNLFDILFRWLLIFLPFTTVITVFTKQVLDLPGVGFYKEFFLAILCMIIVWKHKTNKIAWKTHWIDVLIVIYMITMVVISLFTTGIPGIVYWGRYDFEFLMAFWILFHGGQLLDKPTHYYIRLFLISSWIMLGLSMLLKWPLTEDLLLYLGYCGNPSNWQACNGVPPIFHGIDGANVRRFQGLLDSPNTMWAFLILFSGVFLHFMRQKKDWYFVTGIIMVWLFILIVYTYSRSALIWYIIFLCILGIYNIKWIYRNYKKQLLAFVLIFLAIWSVLFIKFSDNAGAIIGRAWSTQWHWERMITSIDRFKEHPLGQWLWSSWPAYRYIQKVDSTNMEEMDKFYIPESWYIQQFVEGGVLWGMLFLSIMVLLFFLLAREYIIFWAAFAGVATMNLFLHTFESSVVSLLLFLMIGLVLSQKRRIYEK